MTVQIASQSIIYGITIAIRNAPPKKGNNGHTKTIEDVQ
jgi:hypothetical protein